MAVGIAHDRMEGGNRSTALGFVWCFFGLINKA